MYAYPSKSDFFAALPTLLPILRGQVVASADLHALWVAAGYALSNLAPDGVVAAPGKTIRYADQWAMADALAQHAAGSGVSAFNWQALLVAILGLVQTILANHQ